MQQGKLYRLCTINNCGGDLKKHWYVSFYVLNTKTGKLERKREYVSINLDAAERYANLQALKSSIDKLLVNGSLVSESKTKFEAQKPKLLINALSEAIDHKKPQVKHRTFLSYNSQINILVDWLQKRGLTTINVRDFTKHMAYDYLSTTAKRKKWTGKTFNNARGALISLFDEMESLGWIDDNPIKHTRSMNERQPNVKIWTDEQQAILTDYIREHDQAMHLIASLVYFTKLRPNEITYLKFEHFHFQAGIILVESSFTKNSRTQSITMNKRVGEMVREWQGSNPKNYFLFSSNFLPGKTKKHPNAINNRFRKIREHLQLPEYLKLYTFKHKGNIDMHIKHGVTLMQLKELNRHSSLQITDAYMRRNLRIADEQLRNLDADF